MAKTNWVTPNKVPPLIAAASARALTTYKTKRQHIGERYGRLVIEKLEVRSTVRGDGATNFKYYAYCVCDCGEQFTKLLDNILYNTEQGGIQCRACARKQNNKALSISGEGKRTPEVASMFVRVRHMNKRCYDPKTKSYKTYGARGIRVCKRWSIRVHPIRVAVANFIEDMGFPPPEHTLDRENNNGHYTPKNCRWADALTQANNNSRNVHFLYEGQAYTLAQLCRKLREKYDYSGSIAHLFREGLNLAQVEERVRRRSQRTNTKGNNWGPVSGAKRKRSVL